MPMNETLIAAIIGVISNFITATFAYRTGKKKSDNEATRVAFENYKFALESLRSEFERQVTALQKENNELRERVRLLEERENQNKKK